MIVRYPHVHFDQFCCSSVDSEEFEPKALVDSGVAHHLDPTELEYITVEVRAAIVRAAVAEELAEGRCDVGPRELRQMSK
ncbi:unnamed protein product [Camellia sinensis]